MPGARGLEISDQNKIDETVARLCGAKVLPKADCARHTQTSAKRRADLK